MIIFLIVINHLKLTYQHHETTQMSSQYSFNLIEKREIKENNKYYNSSMNDEATSYCSFFNNRAPSTQINLKNCTWLDIDK